MTVHWFIVILNLAKFWFVQTTFSQEKQDLKQTVEGGQIKTHNLTGDRMVPLLYIASNHGLASHLNQASIQGRWVVQAETNQVKCIANQYSAIVLSET